jgi:beta-mannosidase
VPAARQNPFAVSAPVADQWELGWTAPGAATTPAAVAGLGLRWLPATAPGTAAGALRAAGAAGANVEIPFAAPARLDGADWWYRCRFAGAPAAAGEHLSLVFDGLATVADVFLNGVPILHSENMFVRTDVDVTTRLATQNELLIRFHALDGLLAAKRPRPRWRAPMVENQQLRWFRTTLLGRTPGWSPPAPPVGPWRPITLLRQRGFELGEIDLCPTIAGDVGTVALSLALQPIAGAGTGGAIDGARLIVTGPDGVAREAALDVRAAAGEGASSAAAVTLAIAGAVRIAGAARWWPHTHGAQPLYDARVVVTAGGAELTIDLGKIGFRTVTLANAGGDFALSINEMPVFCRGACWTPTDVFTLNASAESLRDTLGAVRAAGMNMVRVCGPMAYETDAFYDLCDELGILVWQDFMFANMDYPQDPAFVAGVQVEAQQNLRRWQPRPSLAVLCGDSEGEQQAAMWGAARATWDRPLFRQTLPAAARAICPDVPYWPSSASGGAFPHQPSEGTTSYYGVGAYRRPLEDARRSDVRFASECLAFANIPDDPMLATLTGGAPARAHTPAWKAGVPRDLGAGWDFDDVRDHYLALLFGVDPATLRSNDPERYLALGRVVTGEVMAAAFAEWRRPGSTCRGALVWFLRDLVPGAGWGLLDAAGRPKAAYHFVRRALQPLALVFSDEGLNGTVLHAVNESATAWQGQLRLTLHRDGEVPVGDGAAPVTVPARGALSLPSAALLEGFRDTTSAYHFGPADHDLAVARLVSASGDVVAEAFFFPTGRARPLEAELGLEASARALSDGDFALVVRSRRFAQAVAVDVPGFVADDNYFHVAPGGSRQVRLRRAGATGDPRGQVQALNARAPTRIALAATS